MTVIYVTSTGGAWVGEAFDVIAMTMADEARAERDRVARDAMAKVWADAALPCGVSPHIAPAPARGKCYAEAPVEAYRNSDGELIELRTAPKGQDRVRVGDAWDVMEEQAARAFPRTVRRAEADFEARRRAGFAEERARHDARMAEIVADGGRASAFVPPLFVPPVFEPPFSATQIAMGRRYAALSERVAAAGVRCASLDGRVGAGRCQRRSKIRPLWRSKSRPVWGERLGACGPHIASPVQGALAVRPIL